jgi:hypothetical protein
MQPVTPMRPGLKIPLCRMHDIRTSLHRGIRPTNDRRRRSGAACRQQHVARADRRRGHVADDVYGHTEVHEAHGSHLQCDAGAARSEHEDPPGFHEGFGEVVEVVSSVFRHLVGRRPEFIEDEGEGCRHAGF